MYGQLGLKVTSKSYKDFQIAFNFVWIWVKIFTLKNDPKLKNFDAWTLSSCRFYGMRGYNFLELIFNEVTLTPKGP